MRSQESTLRRKQGTNSHTRKLYPLPSLPYLCPGGGSAKPDMIRVSGWVNTKKGYVIT